MKDSEPEFGNLVRLHKYISDCGYASRRKAEEMIAEGRVKVNNRVVSEPGTKIDPVRDRVQVGKRFLRPPPKGILLFNKPRGVVSTMSDPEGRPSVADYLTKHYKSYYPVGRLDWDSSGLIVLTNDGELAQHLMHPRFGLERTYHVRVEGRPADSLLRKLETGVTLKDGKASGRVTVMKDDEKSCWLEVSVKEGRNRLVRRMMEKIGHPVMKLKRVSHGPFKLGKLQPGELRKLTETEYRHLRKRILADEEQKTRVKPSRHNDEGLYDEESDTPPSHHPAKRGHRTQRRTGGSGQQRGRKHAGQKRPAGRSFTGKGPKRGSRAR